MSLSKPGPHHASMSDPGADASQVDLDALVHFMEYVAAEAQRLGVGNAAELARLTRDEFKKALTRH